MRPQPSEAGEVQELLHHFIELLALVTKGGVESVVIDYANRLLEPFSPAILAGVLKDALPNVASQRWLR
ncbi:MAG: hypothetical protein QOF51_2581 [Chloroflexota bacterium]|nr:hypothetical protein [Chloroflexota bacterium]